MALIVKLVQKKMLTAREHESLFRIIEFVEESLANPHLPIKGDIKAKNVVVRIFLLKLTSQ
jgi:hypothetical protein